MEKVSDKFLRYVQVDTASSEDNFDCTPSTKCQFDLANKLKDELVSLGLTAEVTPNAYVYSFIPANCDGTKASIGFIAHLDVVEKPKGYGVKPMVHKAYKGGDITLHI
jgi:tripeptide aminopeptidase